MKCVLRHGREKKDPAVLLFVRQMLCRPCYSYSEGSYAVMLATCWSSSTDALSLWWCSGGCLATLLMLLQGFSQRLGDGALCVDSDVFYHLVWLGGLSGASLFCGLCSASLQAICFPGLFHFFSIFSPLCTWVGQPLLGLLQEMSVNCFLLNEIRV